MARPAPCPVCDQIDVAPRRELNLLMGDPTRWPSSVWGVFDAPNGPEVPEKMREWGAIEVGLEYIRIHELGDFSKADVRLHYERHVPLVPTSPDELLAAGIIAAGGDPANPPDSAIDPMAYLRYYLKGLQVGQKGLELLVAHVEQLQKSKREVPLALIKLMLDTGSKLAVSQATIRARQKSQPELEPEDEEDAFRARGGEAPGPRMGHGRIRETEAGRRFVHDEGPKDRAAFNARSRQEGRPGL